MSRLMSPGFALARGQMAAGMAATPPAVGAAAPPPNPYQDTGFIGGAIPVGGAAPPVAGGTPESIQGAYTSAYNQALAQNTANYQNVLGGYQQVAAGQRAAQAQLQGGYGGLGAQAAAGTQQLQGQIAPIRQEVDNRLNVLQDAFDWRNNSFTRREGMLGDVNRNVGNELTRLELGGDEYATRADDLSGGYGRLSRNVMESISGLDAAERRRQQDAYLSDLGTVDQSAVSRGLGNTTIRDSLRRGVTSDFRRAETELTAETQRNNANYLSQLGLAGLSSQERVGARQLDQTNLEAQSRLAAAERLGLYGIQQDERHVDAINQQQNLIGTTRAGYGLQLGQLGLNVGERGLDRELGIGQAGLAAQERGIDRNTGLARDQLGFQASVASPYPNAGQYGALAEAAAAREEARRLNRGGGAAGAGAAGAGQVLTTQPSGRSLDDVIRSTRGRAEQLYPVVPQNGPVGGGDFLSYDQRAQGLGYQGQALARRDAQIDQYVQQQLGPGSLAGGAGGILSAGPRAAAGQQTAAAGVVGGPAFFGGASPVAAPQATPGFQDYGGYDPGAGYDTGGVDEEYDPFADDFYDGSGFYDEPDLVNYGQPGATDSAGYGLLDDR